MSGAEGRGQTPGEVGALLDEAQRRYLHDAKFHARVHRATRFMDCNHRERLIVAVALLIESDEARGAAS